MSTTSPDYPPVSDRFVGSLRHAIEDPPAGVDRWFLSYCGPLANADELNTYVRAKRQLVELSDGVRGKDVLDAGAGFGMVSNLLAFWGAKSVSALEVHKPMHEAHRIINERDFPYLENVRPFLGDVSRMPFAENSFDLVLSIEAISHYFDVDAFFDECARVMRRGGCLLVSDGNNGANPSIRRHTVEIWQRFESGPTGRIGDHNISEPMVDRRARLISGSFPQLGPERARELALATSGMIKDEIETAVRTHLAGGPAPASFYSFGQNPREPFWGYLHETLFDPPELAARAARHGFEARAIPHYGGARNGLLEAVNGVLRGIPSYRFARGFRIVARKR